jgi:hypothetical protein
MLDDELNKMSSKDLWALHLRLNALLIKRLTAQKEETERRLRELEANNPDRRSKRRPWALAAK